MSVVWLPRTITDPHPRAAVRGRFKAAALADLAWPDLVDQALAALGTLSTATSFGLVFVTDLLAGALPEIIARLQTKSPIHEWSGSVGLGICGNDAAYIDRPALSLMVADLPPGSFHPFDHAEVAPDWAAAMGLVRFALVHGDPRHHDPIGAIARLSDQIAVPLAGGLAHARTTPWQIAGHVVEGGLSGVLFDDRVPILCRIIQGTRPIGPERRITKLQGNLIFEIDDQPALAAFTQDIGALLARDLHRAARQITIGLPQAGADQGTTDYLNRPLLALDPAGGWLAVNGPVACGDTIAFCREDRAAATHDLATALLPLAAGADRVDAALYYGFSDQDPTACAQALTLIREILGDVPLAGFYGQGQISGRRLYGQSSLLVLFMKP